MWGMRTVLRLSTIWHSRTLLATDLMKTNLVPLQRPSLGFRFLMGINGIPAFSLMSCVGNPVGFNVWRYSWLNLSKSWLFWSVSALENLSVRPGNLSSRHSFNMLTSLLVGARIVLPPPLGNAQKEGCFWPGVFLYHLTTFFLQLCCHVLMQTCIKVVMVFISSIDPTVLFYTFYFKIQFF